MKSYFWIFSIFKILFCLLLKMLGLHYALLFFLAQIDFYIKVFLQFFFIITTLAPSLRFW